MEAIGPGRRWRATLGPSYSTTPVSQKIRQILRASKLAEIPHGLPRRRISLARRTIGKPSRDAGLEIESYSTAGNWTGI